MTARLVLFDCDGTLVDSAGVIAAAMAAAFAASGLAPPTPAKVRGIIGLSLPEAVRRLAAHHPGAPVGAIAAAYALAYREAATDHGAAEPLFPGTLGRFPDDRNRSSEEKSPQIRIDEHACFRMTVHGHAERALAALDSLAAAGCALGVVTGKSRRGLDRILAAHAVAGRFAVTVTADDAASKPAPDMVLRATEATRVAPARTVVVGDTRFDIEMARAAGATAIGVAWGYHPVAELTAFGAHAIARTMGELPGLVATLEAA